MITIKNNFLTAELLDPVGDFEKTGSRYCVGGYVWQIYDKIGRSLLSGPKFPDNFPPVFDGQGMPEAFEIPLGGGDCAVGENVCVIGVGLVEKSSDVEPFHPRNNPNVVLYCGWDVERGDDFVVMTTQQIFEDKSIILRREVRLVDSCIKSISTINNVGDTDVRIRHFAHPFFPLNKKFSCGKIDLIKNNTLSYQDKNIKLSDNAGYEIDDGGVIFMKRDYPWERGLFQLIDVPNEKLQFTVAHPIADNIVMQTNFNVVRCPIWANANTFSFEPFFDCVAGIGKNISWGIEYLFSPTKN